MPRLGLAPQPHSQLSLLYKGQEPVIFRRVIWTKRAIKGPTIPGHVPSDLEALPPGPAFSRSYHLEVVLA